MKHTLAVISLLFAAAGAAAHDTWFPDVRVRLGRLDEVLPERSYAMGKLDVEGAEHLALSGCRDGDGRPMRLTAVRDTSTALLLRASGPREAPGMSCWAQLKPSEIELAPEIVKLYLDEIHATDAVRQAWSAMQARGVVWKERYVKHARIEAGGGSAALQPSGMDLDILLEAGLRVPRAGEVLAFQVLRDGRALPGQPMELVDGQGRSGGWALTDGEGRVRFTLPASRRWLLRGTQLQPSAADPDIWESGFVTLAFEVR